MGGPAHIYESAKNCVARGARCSLLRFGPGLTTINVNDTLKSRHMHYVRAPCSPVRHGWASGSARARARDATQRLYAPPRTRAPRRAHSPARMEDSAPLLYTFTLTVSATPDLCICADEVPCRARIRITRLHQRPPPDEKAEGPHGTRLNTANLKQRKFPAHRHVVRSYGDRELLTCIPRHVSTTSRSCLARAIT